MIDFGITEKAMVDEVFNCHRLHRHIVDIYNDIEDHIELAKQAWNKEEDDEHLWKVGDGKFKKKFVAKLTLDLIREKSPLVECAQGIWFSYRTLNTLSLPG